MIRVLLVDDQALVRSGFRIILSVEPDIEVVGEAADGLEAVALAAELRPDVICMDVEMPNLDGIAATRRILEQASGAQGDAPGAGVPGDSVAGSNVGSVASSAVGSITGSGISPAPGSASGPVPAILVLTTFGHEEYLFEALAAGVSGFLLKTARAEQFIDAVRTLAAGHALLGPDVTRAVMSRAAISTGTIELPDSANAGADPATGTGTGAEPGTGIGTGPGSGSGSDSGSAPVSGSSSSSGSGGPSASGPGGPSAVSGGSGSSGAAPVLDPAALDALGLTEREREVLALIALGRSNAEIAGELFLGEATIKTHVSKILQKLGARDRIQAVVWAHTHGGLA